MKHCCNNCLYRQKIKSYDPEAAKVDMATHCKCSHDGSIHRKNKEQRGCKNFKNKEDL
jgi:hypothetical protein|nr:MAG TPA: hypothetical protein [Caudoviricetes sp.]